MNLKRNRREKTIECLKAFISLDICLKLLNMPKIPSSFFDYKSWLFEFFLSRIKK